MAKTPVTHNNNNLCSGADRSSQMDAIDRMFAEFELVYHNQCHKALAKLRKETGL